MNKIIQKIKHTKNKKIIWRKSKMYEIDINMANSSLERAVKEFAHKKTNNNAFKSKLA